VKISFWNKNQNKILERVTEIIGREFIETKKHSEFTLHVIETIALDKKHPVQAFSISEDYTNGSVFEQFVTIRNLANHIDYDIIDRHGSHKAVQANINRGTIPTTYWRRNQTL
jgi:hypothetical protein